MSHSTRSFTIPMTPGLTRLMERNQPSDDELREEPATEFRLRLQDHPCHVCGATKGQPHGASCSVGG